MPLPPDANQFLNVIEDNKGIIYKVANAYCIDRENRKDLIQEIIIQLWLAFPRYDQQFRLTTWIYRIALNVSISFYRKQASRARLNQPLTDDIISFITVADVQPDVDTELSMLNTFIRELKELDRALILLYLEERSQQEISEILGITISNVSTKVSRIKEQLKQKFITSKS
ncbi:sigma-70 family RNA polymerase sigma factor [Dyadobacter chenwenxiniae]|uniref:Sigma-70 family RNA polymerase sigma factor n=1 Tax=Dyadobacter chenwenxiniae TaxID=2906456 RepID=A0A9X1PQN0_9BACT|nr:sigma-70 family RNA polymerase sigma factor [Dyadobacter chenwenxiniae]MCF0049139.1 sigma-70 family RNA polymerase sigma factor [Dyadobacter chenwenxiniae]MCF0064654.1 sigma-70 family RNA polymerase sigma factor [Dyadobacter chenwenxiniae]UON84292.1 sigma-70 family RNA polymerase sigma factor [Dyadobacter chenwenxiniae]